MNINGLFFKIIVFAVVFLLLNITSLNCNAVLEVKGEETLEKMQKLMEPHIAYFDKDDHGIYESGDLEDDTWTMVEKRGNQFVVNDKPFYVNGFNAYWLMIFAANQSTRGKVSEVYKQASSVGLTVCRTWAFNDGPHIKALQLAPSVYDQEVFQGLDFVISEAKKYKIRLILSLVNNWHDYGGKAQYVKWGKEEGLNLTSEDNFFTHPTLKAYYKSHVKEVLNRVNTFTNIRYKDDPTIFAWELMNEPRCTSDPSGDKLQAWVEEMAFNVKRIDPKHLVEIGLEGFYGPSTPDKVKFNPTKYFEHTGTDFIRNHQVLGVDFASVHMYPDNWISHNISDTHLQFVRSWMQAHIDNAENLLRMPVIFSEFGVSSKSEGYNSTYRDTFVTLAYNNILESVKQGGSGGGSLFWQLFPEGMEYMHDGCAIVLSKSHSTAYIMSLQSERVKMFNSLCNWECRWGYKNRNDLV